MRIIPQTAFTLWGSHVSYIPGVCATHPRRLCHSSFLLLFTTLWLHGERLVQARRSLVHVFIVKHDGFEHSNGPIPPVAQIRPGTSNGPQMDPKLTQMHPKFIKNPLHFWV